MIEWSEFNMNNIKLNSYQPIYNCFKFRCRECNSIKLEISPISYPFYKSKENYNKFNDYGCEPLPLVTAIKKANEFVCECKECGCCFSSHYTELMHTYLSQWIKANKIKKFEIIDYKIRRDK